MVLLIGNYAPDHQQSMDRFATMMLDGLTAEGVPAEILKPQPFFGAFSSSSSLLGKWLGYVDKFVMFRLHLRRKLRSAPAVVHVCDHSNAMYARQIKGAPVVVTCHDLLAVRGAFGEATDCPASPAGKFLQRWIVAGLNHASALACDSRATLADAVRLVRADPKPQMALITLGLSYPYRQVPRVEAEQRIAAASSALITTGYVLHVGSNLARKNREGVLRIFAKTSAQWRGMLVIAGDPLSDKLRTLARELRITERVVEIARPSNELLEALYSCATALIYPSRFEGFGWPIAEAQACGCPVVCTNADPMSEVGGEAVLKREVTDEDGFAADILRMTDPAEHAHWRTKSLENARRFSTSEMISKYRELYRSVGAPC